MSDRIFAGVLLVVTLIYGYLAVFVIRAPFQYDPLGPESWPQLMAGLMVPCLIALLWRPDIDRFDLEKASALRLGLTVVMLIAYAELYEPFGFILSTLLFAALFSRMLGASWLQALIFGAGMGVGGYLLCVGLLDLNLPAGPLPSF
ncbi:tripartite tricarboxylate transporter TctB family protein [Paracoccus sp. (in: a-proteobacteria)]|uniref:tripartite tricarboxylate transporter TctB family protein n=1 Tax=Paracoccus sp. TaxID=267 RepID=UPI003A8AE55C